MISIQKSLNDLGRLDEFTAAVVDSYAMAIQSSSHYAVEIDPFLVAEYREHLQTIEQQSRATTSPDRFRELQASFRGELREYRDKAAVYIKKLHKEIENATAAMMVFADTVASNGTNHEHEVNAQLRALKSASLSNSIEEIRGGITSAVTSIDSSIQQIHRGNQLIVAQLQDEIRALHQQISAERKVLYTDRASGAWNRQKVDQHIDNLLRQNQPFCLLLVWVRNYKRLENQYSRTIMECLLKAVIGRLAALSGDEAVTGRWCEDQFVAVLDLQPGNAISLSADATRKLSGSYSIQENGLAQKVNVQATAGVVDRIPGSDSSKFREKLDQLSSAISGA